MIEAQISLPRTGQAQGFGPAPLMSSDVDDPLGSLPALEALAAGAPWWDEPWARQGQIWRRVGDVAQAARCYAAALERNPDCFEALLALGSMRVAGGEVQKGVPLLRRCCTLSPASAKAHHAFGLALMLLDEPVEAFEALAIAHAVGPSSSLCAIHLADAAHALGESNAALQAFERERRRAPSDVGVLAGLATALTHLGRRDEALMTLEAATLMEPDHPVVVPVFADMLARTTRQADAEIALRQAIALDADNGDAVMALSVVLMRLHRHVEAVALLTDLLERDINPVGPLCNLATALVALGKQDEAVLRARDAIRAGPQHPAPYRALCNALPYQQGVTGASLLAAAEACSARQPRAALPALCNSPAINRQLRIGLLSGTLRTHPVGWLTVAAIEHLDRSQFDITCFSQNRPEDAIGRRFARVATSWEDTGALNDRQVAERGRALGIDIVIDLGGYGDMGRMPVLTHRMSPVQIKWVGMQNHSTGIAEMDWFITDRWETPSALARFYSERLLELPDGYVCYSPPDYAPAVAELPAAKRGYVTFGCYNNLAKITPLVLATWARILRAIPSAALILKTHQFNNALTCGELRHAFASQGIAPQRVSLRGSSPHRDVLAQYADVDMILDPFPYSGGLTTCEALWMGVPTLTFPGETFASRHSASHMSNVGLKDWVMPDLKSYVAQAVERAGRLPELALLRADLRERMRTSPLCDAPRFGAGLGKALRGCWKDWCLSQSALVDVKPLF